VTKNSKTKPENQFCGGTLVGDKYVITSAECTYFKSANNISVLVGDTTLGVANDTSRFFFNVSEIRQHPEYNNATYQNNIAVLVLSSPVDLKAHPSIKPACLPSSDTKFDSNYRKAVLSGWGTVGKVMLDEDTYSNSNLYNLGVKILPNCSKWQDLKNITNDMLCGDVLEEGSFCIGDGGGPLVTMNNIENNGAATLVGVFNLLGESECTESGWPGLFTDVTHYMQNGWLMSQLTDLKTCPPPASI